jgi:tol-pal system protein YbgF
MAAIRIRRLRARRRSAGRFQRRYPASPYLDSVRFWQGNALYGKRDYKEAIAVFRAFVTSSPEHPRAPEALLALANSQAEMKDPRGARKTIDELLKAYPKSEAAQAGKERLAAIK